MPMPRFLLLLPLLFAVGSCGLCSRGEATLQCSPRGGTLSRQDLFLCTTAPHNIRSLRIAPPPMHTASADAFVNFTMLRCLDMQGLNITALPETMFVSLLALEELDLSGNQLRTLPPAIFVSVLELASLDLSRNVLSQLHTNLFANLIELRYLNLSANHLTSLPERLFASLVQLRRLDLSANQLKTLSAHAPPRWPIGFELRRAANPLPVCWSFNRTHLGAPNNDWWWCFDYDRIITGIYAESNFTIVAGNLSSGVEGRTGAVSVWHSPKGFLYSYANGTVWWHSFDIFFSSSVRVLSPGGGVLQITHLRSYFTGIWSLLSVHPSGAVRVLAQVMVQCRSPLRDVYIWSLIVSSASIVVMLLAGLLTALIRLLFNTRCFTRKILVVSALSLEELQYSPRTQRKRLFLLRKYEANRAALLAQEARANHGSVNSNGGGGDASTGSASLLNSTAGSLDESTGPESPPPWLPPHRLATYDLFSHGGASETEPETPLESETEDVGADADGASWWRVEEFSERLRAGMSRHVDQVRSRMRERRHNMEESTSRMMGKLRTGSQVAVVKMRSGLANSVDVVKWKVRNITELCGGGVASLGQTVSVSTLVTDVDTQTTTQRRVVDVTAV